MTNSIIILSFLIFSCFQYLLITPATCSSNKTDFLSLLALKEAIDLDAQGSLNSWNQSTNFCRWNGIICGRKHPYRVVAINLRSQGLLGSLSPHIGNLSFLRSIDLRNNSFHGQIPQEIGLLRRLQFLRLNNNSFMGTIPRNLSQCKNLVFLNLISNNLFGVIPPELGFLKKLEALGLTWNTLLGSIPQSIGNLTSLKQLQLRSCGLEGEIPKSFTKLERLITLQIGMNNLTGSIPTGLFNISTIENFVVDINRLEGPIPYYIGLTLPNLRFLSLGQNQLNGHISISLSNASSLEVLVLSNNSFTGPMPRFGGLSRLEFVYAGKTFIEDDISLIISSLVNCTNLQVVDLGQNPFLSGSIPNTIANLSNQLDELAIDSTQIVGKFPSGIGNLVGLTFLDVSGNNLEGPISLSIGRLFNLHYLDLGENRFTSDIPSTFGNLTLLYYLSLRANNFSGIIPKTLANCTNLQQLDLSQNNFNDPIPPEILISTISISLDLSNNAFMGSIPIEVGSLTNLASLDLSNNKLSGLIPNSLGSCITLEQLYLDDNLFEGQIPEGLSSLMSLIDLDLSRNNLSGSIPSFLSELHLQKLNLSYNRLQGEVPIAGVFKNRSAISLEVNKQLCGGILQLNLPLCTSSSVSIKKKISTPLKIVVSIAGVATILCIIIFMYKRRTINRSLNSLPSSIGTQFFRLSYADLLKATNDFSGDNLVGMGGFGSVYKGILDDEHTIVAVKVLNLDMKGASKSFIAECNALRGIRHRNLVKILSVCESIDFKGNDFKALVYEFKANKSLDKWLHYNTEQENESDAQPRYLDMIERLNIAIDIAHALEYLHCGTDTTIVHGDMKPSNIILDYDMVAYVGDFGLSKIVSSMLPPCENSSTIGIRGTVGYVPPEYGTNNSVSKEGDVYSYGILVLEMFTNKRPTSDSFMDHVNLHNFVSAALPDCVMEIMDPLIAIGPHRNNSKIEDCIYSILCIGVSCSKQMPRDRMSTADVVTELHKIKNIYQLELMN